MGKGTVRRARGAAVAWAVAFVLVASVARPAHALILPIVPRSILKTYFERGDKPTESQFGSLIDSALNVMVHEDNPTLSLDGIAVSGTTNNALRLAEGQIIDGTLTFTAPGNHPVLEPLWAGEFGFLPLRFTDGGTANSYYGYLQIQMESAPVPDEIFADVSEPPAIYVQYLSYNSSSNVPVTATLIPEPTALAIIVPVAALLRRRR
jgi:hypothetical protein